MSEEQLEQELEQLYSGPATPNGGDLGVVGHYQCLLGSWMCCSILSGIGY
jgi:hypothetical protein